MTSETFAHRVRIDPETACHIWTGFVGRDGYGRTTGSGFRSAHRFAWELAGRDLPPGLCVLHTYDVRLCVNPDHLFLGTKLDNSRDMARKGRGRRGTMPYGVSCSGRNFKVRLCFGGELKTIGIYKTLEAASAAALRAKVAEYSNSETLEEAA